MNGAWLLRNLATSIGALIVTIIAIAAAFAPWLAPYDPNALDLNAILQPPSSAHPMGTDRLGRDVLSRMIHGARISLAVSFVAVGLSTLLGLIFGAIAGYYRGHIDSVIMRLVDIMLSIPTFFLLLATIAFLEPSIINIMAVIGLTSWMGVTRLVRAEFLSLHEREFVLAAVAQGASDWRLIRKHYLPNSLGPVIVTVILGIAGAILVESGLSFLGLGVQPPTASWGNILTEGKDNIQFAWWLSFYPGLAILVTVLGYNLLGEGLREAFNPHQTQR